MFFRDAYIGEDICICDIQGNYKYYGCKYSENELLIKKNYINPNLIGAIFFIEKNAPIERI